MNFTVVMKVVIEIMMMRTIMKIMNTISYRRVLSIIAAAQFHQFLYKNHLTILPSADTVV